MKSGLGIMLLICWLGVNSAKSQSIPVVKFDQLQQLITKPNDTLYVVNFWATWCAPCVKELPLFDALKRTYATKKVKVMLVSMDTKKTLTTKVVPFVRNRKIKSTVLLLDETDLNTWVDKLVPEWSGALPMTVLLNKKQNIRRFVGKPVEDGELESIINQYKL
ncbi:TlpA disulfide reductase family protein [Spirosoma sp.]|uniref:TlpA disulfide reductase family protein n=1 Tax=Spirosoma sp. TaxID=1899569 RepID=UPI003B3B28FB